VGGCVPVSRAESIRTVWSCLKRRPPFLFWLPGPAAAGRKGRGDRSCVFECFDTSVAARGAGFTGLITVYSIQYTMPEVGKRNPLIPQDFEFPTSGLCRGAAESRNTTVIP